jgi:hypothetical protein
MEPESRYRCGACGNLTRFDVLSTRRTRRFVHFSLSGDPAVDEEEVIEETIESITCRWCNASGDQIEIVPRSAPLGDGGREA